MTTNDSKTNDGMDAGEMLDTLKIIDVRGRRVRWNPEFGGGWVTGTIAGHRFEALVFPEPADDRTWEVGGDSRISKLWLQRISDDAEVYNWDRGADVEPRTVIAEQIVDLLAAGLAETVFGSEA